MLGATGTLKDSPGGVKSPLHLIAAICDVFVFGRARPSDSYSRDGQVDAASQAENEAPEGERHERPRLEVAHQELDREVGGRRGADRADERLPANAVALVTEELRQLIGIRPPSMGRAAR